MTLDDFIVFIMCHENPDKIKTLIALERYGYTGKWKLVLDDKDKCIEEYKNKYGANNILIFNKEEVANTIDEMMTNADRRCIVYARNKCFDFAQELGYKYFLELDEDFIEFQFRYISEDKLKLVYPVNLDEAFISMFTYLEENPNITSIALSQGGDHIGGVNGNYKKGLMRKCMNSFFCDIDRRFQFNGTTNEDVNTYCLEGSRGSVFLTYTGLMVNQTDTQTANVGITDLYKKAGTYQKSFFTVLCCPSFVKVSMMGDNHYRIHHNINWENAVPKIISDKYKKEKEGNVKN